MYLVELKPGMETIYSSVAELTEAVRRGEVTEAAKVFHRARSEWAPITAHPKFREIVASLRSGPARKEWTFLPAKPGETAPAPIEEPPAAATASHAPATPAKARSRRGWRLMLGSVFGQQTG
jgi:hypothetical protein